MDALPAFLERHDDLGRCIVEAEVEVGVRARSRRTPKVDERPGVLRRQPNCVAGLEVAVHEARRVQLLQLARYMHHHLQPRPKVCDQ